MGSWRHAVAKRVAARQLSAGHEPGQGLRRGDPQIKRAGRHDAQSREVGPSKTRRSPRRSTSNRSRSPSHLGVGLAWRDAGLSERITAGCAFALAGKDGTAMAPLRDAAGQGPFARVLANPSGSSRWTGTKRLRGGERLVPDQTGKPHAQALVFLRAPRNALRALR